MPCPEESLRPASVIESKRKKHSEKSDGVYEIIERIYPTLKKIELFARKKRKVWKKWGKMIDKTKIFVSYCLLRPIFVTYRK